jgi:hypothetical protein
MGGTGAMVSPPPIPSPIKGEGRCGMTDVTAYLPLSARRGGGDRQVCFDKGWEKGNGFEPLT